MVCDLRFGGLSHLRAGCGSNGISTACDAFRTVLTPQTVDSQAAVLFGSRALALNSAGVVSRPKESWGLDKL
jgi:hypothetical protein